MARVFTLESFNEEAEKKFGSLQIGDVTLRAVLSLDDHPENDEVAEYRAKSEELNNLYKYVQAHQALVERLQDAKEDPDTEEDLELLEAQVEASEAGIPSERDLKVKTLEMLRITTKNKVEFDALTRDFSSAQVYTLLTLYSEGTQAGEA